MWKEDLMVKLAVWCMVLTIALLFTAATTSSADGGLLQATVQADAQNPLEGVKVYLFNENGAYLGQSQVTDSAGRVGFDVSEGSYQLRADYLGYRCWSPATLVAADIDILLAIPHRDVSITVEGVNQGSAPLAGVRVYLFTASGSYQGQYQVTDAGGQVAFNLPEQPYKVRVDFQGQQFWSEEFTWIDTIVGVPMADGQVRVNDSGVALEGVDVYVFSESGSYLGLTDRTDAGGQVNFALAAGTYNFRADYQGSQYWSQAQTLTAGQTNSIDLSTGGGRFTLTVLGGANDPLAGINCYVFNEQGTYLGLSGSTDAAGEVSYALADGTYKFRLDYSGHQFWTDLYDVQGTDISDSFVIPHRDVSITVEGVNQGSAPLAGVRVYLFTASGSYQGQNQVTDAGGQVAFNLPEQPYQVRVDYQDQQFWSQVFTWQDTTVSVPMADGEITVTGSGLPLEGVDVYVFSESGSYLDLTDKTDAGGQVNFALAAGIYNFRADYQGSQYWSQAQTLVAGQTNSIALSTGGGTFTLRVLKGANVPLAGINCYVFNGQGAYLGLSGSTDAAGEVSFALADGTYKFRLDYSGHEFWTDAYDVPAALTDDFLIAHQDVLITVEAVYQGQPTPMEGLPVYLFKPSGAYLGQSLTTDANGQVAFSLPQQPFQVRVDYLGQQFWSDEFSGQNTTVTIPLGMAAIHVHRIGTDVPGADVYLFSLSNAYLDWNETTTAEGMAQFLLPARSFRFRADEGGDQRWSDDVTISADQVTSVDLNLADYPPAVTLEADPEIIRANGASTLTWTSNDADSVTIDQGIGNVELSGSLMVAPAETATYTITATGPGGTASAWATVTVNAPPAVTVVQPDGINDIADADFKIQWIDDDPDDDATLALYYDTDSSGADGTLIVAGLSEDADLAGDDEYVWDTSGIAEGTYYVYAVIDDGVGDPVVEYGAGVLTIERYIPDKVKLTASDGETGDEFGWSVSISGDYALVGAQGDDEFAGSAYVYKREGAVWSEQVKLTADEADEARLTGNFVALDGDYALVGAWGKGEPGYVYIFKREGMNWPQQFRFAPEEAGKGSEFGWSGAISGDYVIMGDPAHNDYAGLVYVYKRDGAIWTQQAILGADDAGEGAGFGYSVSVSGDYAIVGALGEVETGSAYIFERVGEVWTQQAKLVAGDVAEWNNFGYSVSINDDYAIVGDNSADTGDMRNAGAAYIYKREGTGNWVEQAKITAADAEERGRFGSSVSMDGDYALVGGMHSDSDNIQQVGAAYIFKREGSDWVEQAIITVDDAYVDSEHGIPVSINGRFAMAGNFRAGSEEVDETGAAYIFLIDSYVGRPFIKINEPDGYHVPTDGFSKISWTDLDSDDDAQISIYYDNDNSGADGTLIVNGLSEDLEGAGDTYLWDTSQINSGLYYIYAVIDDGENEPVVDYSSGGVMVDPPSYSDEKVVGGEVAAEDAFGYAVSISGDYAMVGAYHDSVEGRTWRSGSAYIFKREGGIWNEEAKLTAGDAVSSDFFGGSVSIDGDYAIAGAYGNDDAGSSSGSAYIFKHDGTKWSEEAKLTAGDAAANDYFGDAVSISGDYVIVGADGDDDGGAESGAVYIFKRESAGWTQQAKLTAPDAAAYDYFGSAVSISGDYAIVGSYGDDDGGSSSGSAYIFKRDGSAWIQQAKLTADAADTAYYNFGKSVNINETYAIVGAPLGNGYRGAAFIFERQGSNWVQQAELTAIDADPYQYFGYAVSIDGDYAVAGAYGDEDNGSYSGSVYVYKRSDTEWILNKKLTAADGAEYDYYGRIVSISGDAAIVGAYGNDDRGSYSGSAYIYQLEDASGAASIQVVEPSGDSDAVDAGFTIKWRDYDFDSNASISLYYDTDNSGADGTLIVSGLNEDPDDSGSDAYQWDTAYVADGTYYVYAVIDDGEHGPVVDYSDGTVTVNNTEIELQAGDAAGGDRFGYAVDLDGAHAIVGAYGHDDGGDGAGSAYIFKRDGGWSELVKLMAADRSVDDNFGRSVAIDGDYAIVGAPSADAGYGAAYIFKHDGTAWGSPFKLSAGDAGLYDEFGISVAMDGDYAVVGAWGDDNYAGAVYIFKRVGSTWIEDAKIIAGERWGDSYFGWSVAIDGDYVAVGAYWAYASGAAYIFKREGENWIEKSRLTLGEDIWDYHFGYSVDIDDPYLIVGARGQEYELLSPGAAYIFKRMGEFWAEQATITAAGPQALDYFGCSVSIDGDRAIVGASGEPRDPNAVTGRAYVFSRSGEAWALHSELDSGQPAEYDAFGASVAINGGYGLVGAPGPHYGESDPGAAYLFLFSRVNISASHEQIRSGEITTLSWSYVDATHVSIDNGIGEVSGSGSFSVSPSETTTYTITAIGPWGTFTDSVTVTVVHSPTVNLNADTLIHFPGDSAILTWSSTNAESCVIEPAIGNVSLNGSLEITPTETTTYTITATGPGGSAEDAVEVRTVIALEDANYGIDTDEQQGGGGLVGETIRILDGNMVDIRSDLQFPSPCRFGLRLDAVYNSRSESLGSMGYGWSHTYEVSLDPAVEIEGLSYLKIVDGTGRASFFRESAPDQFAGLFGEYSHVMAEAGDLSGTG